VDEKIMDDALVQALGKAKLWENELMSGEIDLEEFCRRKRLTVKYVLKVLRLNTLSPSIKSAIMNGTQPKTLVLKDLLQKPFPMAWREQINQFFLTTIIVPPPPNGSCSSHTL
jgi:hypothetical protein